MPAGPSFATAIKRTVVAGRGDAAAATWIVRGHQHSNACKNQRRRPRSGVDARRLDLEEWMSVAKKGEMCNRELLNPKYRFMMETRRRRAAERDAAAAAVAAKAAEIDALKREHARVRQEWEEKDKARRGANAKTRKEHRKASQRLAASQTRERQHR